MIGWTLGTHKCKLQLIWRCGEMNWFNAMTGAGCPYGFVVFCTWFSCSCPVLTESIDLILCIFIICSVHSTKSTVDVKMIRDSAFKAVTVFHPLWFFKLLLFIGTLCRYLISGYKWNRYYITTRTHHSVSPFKLKWFLTFSPINVHLILSCILSRVGINHLCVG